MKCPFRKRTDTTRVSRGASSTNYDVTNGEIFLECYDRECMAWKEGQCLLLSEYQFAKYKHNCTKVGN